VKIFLNGSNSSVHGAKTFVVDIEKFIKHSSYPLISSNLEKDDLAFKVKLSVHPKVFYGVWTEERKIIETPTLGYLTSLWKVAIELRIDGLRDATFKEITNEV
jgi:hypothetical protein